MARSTLPRHEAKRLAAVASTREDPVAEFERLEQARLAGEPLQYLEGTAAFGPIELLVDDRVLIPRPETEQLWELSLRLAGGPAVVVDLCTGSGALALAWKAASPGTRVLGADVSESALEVARANSLALGLEVEWLYGDLFEALPGDLRGQVDLIVCNPPYISEAEWPDLPDDVRREPQQALVAGPDGLEVLRRVAAGSVDWLRTGAWIVCEIGETQGPECVELFRARCDEVAVLPDLAGRDRFVVGRRR